jgi:hypothetical protein
LPSTVTAAPAGVDRTSTRPASPVAAVVGGAVLADGAGGVAGVRLAAGGTAFSVNSRPADAGAAPVVDRALGDLDGCAVSGEAPVVGLAVSVAAEAVAEGGGAS